MNKPYYSFVTSLLRFFGVGKRHPGGQERYLQLFDENRLINTQLKQLSHCSKLKGITTDPDALTLSVILENKRGLIAQLTKNIKEMKHKNR